MLYIQRGSLNTMHFLIPKGHMVFFEFWSGSHGFTAIFFIFLGLVLLFEIYPSM